MSKVPSPSPFLLPAAILWLLPGIVLADPSAGTDSAAAVSGLEAERAQGFSANDPARLAACCSDDSRLITEGVPTVLGAANVRTYFRAFFARYTVLSYSRDDVQLWTLGTRVAAFGRFAVRLRPKSAGAELELHGKFLDLWRPDRGPGWQLAATAWNYDAWLPNGDSVRFDGVPSVRTALQARAPLDTDVALELAASGLLIQRAVVEHDADLWGRFYTDDAVLLPNNAPIAAGPSSITAFLGLHCRELPIFEQLDLRNDRVEEDGSFVFEFASHTASWRNGSSSGVSMGKNLRIWRREPDHMLKMVLQISAYD